MEFTVPSDGKSTMKILFDPKDECVKNLDKVKNDSVKIGTINLDIDDLKKIRFNLKQSILKYNPPSQDILSFENDSAKFEKLLRKSIDKTAGNQNEIAKIQLYGFICRLFAYDIKGLEEIELNDEELEKLGVISNKYGYHSFRDVIYDLDKERKRECLFKISGSDEKIAYLTERAFDLNKSGYDTTIRQAFYRKILKLSSATATEDLLKYNGWDISDPIKIHPIALTIFIAQRNSPPDKRFPGLFMAFESSPILRNPDSLSDNFTWKDEAFSSMVNKFIPIKLYIPKDKICDTCKIQYNEYTLWYLLNEDLIKALPERYHKGLQREYELITSVAEGEIPLVEACKQMEEHESYLDLCRYESASIKDLLVFPNPIRDNKFNLKFNLSKDCNIRIDIHEVSGKFIANIDNTLRQAGTNEFQLELGKLISSGVYLLSIKTNTGEQVVRRLIVE